MGLYGKARVVDDRRSNLKDSILRDVYPYSSEYSALLFRSQNVQSTVPLIPSSMITVTASEDVRTDSLTVTALTTLRTASADFFHQRQQSDKVAWI